MFPIILSVLGACLVYSEINRLFTRSLAAVAENLADALCGNGLKIVLGFGLMYAGYMLWLGSQPGRLILEFQFPFFRPVDEGRDAFLFRCLRIAGLWIVCCLVGTWIFWGVIFPAWLQRVWIWSIKAGLLAIAALAAREIHSHLGQNSVSLPIAIVFWIIGVAEVFTGIAMGFRIGAQVRVNSDAVWQWGTSTWIWLRLGERTALYILSVLITFGAAWLLGLPGWHLVEGGK